MVQNSFPVHLTLLKCLYLYTCLYLYLCHSALFLFLRCRLLLSIAFLRFLPSVFPPYPPCPPSPPPSRPLPYRRPSSAPLHRPNTQTLSTHLSSPYLLLLDIEDNNNKYNNNKDNDNNNSDDNNEKHTTPLLYQHQPNTWTRESGEPKKALHSSRILTESHSVTDPG